jgi:hypothetical protein
MSKLLFRILVSLFVFLAVDAIVFHSGFYEQILSIHSYSGTVYYFAKYERLRPPSKQTDVLILGDSRIGEGFSVQQADRQASGHLRFAKMGIGGMSKLGWYYILKHVDMRADRYWAIVIPLESYRQCPEELMRNYWYFYPLDIEMLLPTLSLPEATRYGLIYPDWDKKLEVWSRALIAAQNYRLDIQDLLLHPLKRMAEVSWRNSLGAKFSYDYDGHPETMEGLSVSLPSRKLTYPSRLSESEKELVKARYTESVDCFGPYETHWIKKIVNYYQNTRTRIFLVRLPTNPIPEALSDRGWPIAPLIKELEGNGSDLRVIGENVFSSLERPSYFWDTRHLNRAGRQLFTKGLVNELMVD